MMMKTNKRSIIIYDILVSSLHHLYEVDYFNIKNGVSERNICARLAHHMENTMHGISLKLWIMGGINCF